MPYMVGGYPDHAASLAVAEAFADAGADLIELGVPFSDPLADGPVIHAAATAALEAGATLDSTLEICASVSGRVPVLLMTYSNMILARGPKAFAEAAAGAGAAGAIVPDLSFEESAGIRETLASRRARARPARRPDDAAGAPPAYLRSGRRLRLPRLSGRRHRRARRAARPSWPSLIEEVRGESPVPVAVGFGIGTPEQAAGVGAVADGVIIGSRLVREVAEASGPQDAAARVQGFLEACRESMAGVR